MNSSVGRFNGQAGNSLFVAWRDGARHVYCELSAKELASGSSGLPGLVVGSDLFRTLGDVRSLAHGDHDQPTENKNDYRLGECLSDEHRNEQREDDGSSRDGEPEMLGCFDVLGEHSCDVSGGWPYS